MKRPLLARWMTNMPVPQQKPAPAAPPREQNTLKWLLGMKETEDEKKAREARQERDKRAAESIKQAIRNVPKAKEVADKYAPKKQ